MPTFKYAGPQNKKLGKNAKCLATSKTKKGEMWSRHFPVEGKLGIVILKEFLVKSYFQSGGNNNFLETFFFIRVKILKRFADVILFSFKWKY